MPGAYSITISAVDAASGVLEGVNKRIEALNKRVSDAAMPFKRLAENFEKFSQVTGIDKIATGFADVARAGTQTFQSLLRVIEPLAAITGAASLAGMYKLVAAWGEFATVLGQQSSRAGMSAESLYNLQNAAKLAGISADDLTGGMTTLNDNMRNAAFGGAPQFLNVLRNLHLSYEDLQKMTPEQRLKAIADALKNVQSVTDRALYTKEIFGGEGMLPFLAKGAEGINKWGEASKNLTGGFSPEMVKRARDFRDAQEGLTQSLSGLGNYIADVLGPVLTPFLNQLTGAAVHMREWIDANQDWLRGEISTKVGEFVTWLGKVDWKQIGSDILSIVHAAEGFVTALAAWIPGGTTTLTWFGTLWLTGMLSPIAKIVLALLELPAKAVLAAAGANAALITIGGGAAAAGLAVLGYLGFKGAQASGENIGKAAELGLQLGGSDEYGNPTFYLDKEGNRVMPDEVEKMGGGANVPAGGRPVVTPNNLAADKTLPPEARALLDTIAGPESHGEYNIINGGRHFGDLSHHPGWINPASNSSAAGRYQFITGTWNNASKEAGGISGYQPEQQDQGAWAIAQATFKKKFGGDLLTALRDPRQHAKVQAALGGSDLWTTFNMGGYDSNLRRETAVPNAPPRPLDPEWTTPAVPNEAIGHRPSGDPAPLPSAAGGAGPPGATGRVEMNVRVLGAPTSVTAQSSGDVDLKIANPGLLGADAPRPNTPRGY